MATGRWQLLRSWPRVLAVTALLGGALAASLLYRHGHNWPAVLAMLLSELIFYGVLLAVMAPRGKTSPTGR